MKTRSGRKKRYRQSPIRREEEAKEKERDEGRVRMVAKNGISFEESFGFSCCSCQVQKIWYEISCQFVNSYTFFFFFLNFIYKFTKISKMICQSQIVIAQRSSKYARLSVNLETLHVLFEGK